MLQIQHRMLKIRLIKYPVRTEYIVMFVNAFTYLAFLLTVKMPYNDASNKLTNDLLQISLS